MNGMRAPTPVWGEPSPPPMPTVQPVFRTPVVVSKPPVVVSKPPVVVSKPPVVVIGQAVISGTAGHQPRSQQQVVRVEASAVPLKSEKHNSRQRQWTLCPVYCCSFYFAFSFFTCVIGFAVFPKIVSSLIANALTVTSKNDGWDVKKPYVDDFAKYQTLYFWNITNKDQFMNGLEPPMLQEVGPYVFKSTRRVYNVTWLDDGKQVLRKSNSFYQFKPKLSCPTCHLRQVFHVTNFYWAYLLEGFQRSEFALVLSFTPYYADAGVQASEAEFKESGLSSDPAKLHALAVQQWADCSVLNGKSIKDGPNGARYPYYLEFCAWAKLTGSPVANLTASKAQWILYDSPAHLVGTSDMLPLVFGGPMAAAAKLNVTEAEATAILNYIKYLTGTLVSDNFRETYLTSGTSGPIVTRTVEQLVFGWVDGVVATFVANTNPQAAVLRLAYSFDDIFNTTHWHIPYSTEAYHMNEVDKIADIMKTGKGNASESGVLIQQGRFISTAGVIGNLKSFPYKNASSPVNVTGTQGANFRWKLKEGDPLTLWFDLFFREMPLDYEKTHRVGGWNYIYRYHLAEANFQTCGENHDNCKYSNQVHGVFDMSEFFPGYRWTQPHFLNCDPVLKASLGAGGDVMKPNKALHDTAIDVEPRTGLMFQLHTAWMSSNVHFQGDLFHTNIWTSNATKEVWIPWVTLDLNVTTAFKTTNAVVAVFVNMDDIVISLRAGSIMNIVLVAFLTAIYFIEYSRMTSSRVSGFQTLPVHSPRPATPHAPMKTASNVSMANVKRGSGNLGPRSTNLAS
eukprot:jgi/Chlat1/703/Chrsp104S01203